MAERSPVPVGASNALSGLSGLFLSGINGRSAIAVPILGLLDKAVAVKGNPSAHLNPP